MHEITRGGHEGWHVEERLFRDVTSAGPGPEGGYGLLQACLGDCRIITDVHSDMSASLPYLQLHAGSRTCHCPDLGKHIK